MQALLNSSANQNVASGLKVWVSDQTIILEKLRMHDSATFKSFYQHYAAAVFGIILRKVKDERTSKIILEHIFICAWDTMGDFDEKNISLFTWLNQIANKQIKNYFLNEII